MGSETIKLDHLRYFITAVETGSFAAAGEKLNITPTSVAHGISALEATMGNDLLIRRRSSGVIPTRQGKKVEAAARRVLLEVENLVEDLRPETNKLSGEIILGCQEGLTWSVAPIAIQEMRRLHPDVRISTKTVFMDEGFAPLESGAIDLLLTFMTRDVNEPNLYHEILCQPQAYAMMRENHPAMNYVKAGKVSLKNLVDYPHIFIEDGPAYPLFWGMYEERGLTPNNFMVSNISPGAQAIVGKSDAISLRIVRPSIDLSPLGDKLAYIELKDTVMRPDVVAVTLKNSQSRISRKTEALIDVCRQKFEDGSMRDNFYY